MLVTMKELLVRAMEGNYAVLAPSMQCEGHMKMAIRAAEEMKSPIILNHRYDRFDDDFKRYAQIARQLAERTWVPVAINQDHGINEKENMAAISAGYTSIMVDRQIYPLDENIQRVAYMTKIAHHAGVTVESELGEAAWGDMNEVEAGKTKPEEVKRFVEETGIDCLAVCIGNTNSMTTPKDQVGVTIDIDLLARIEKETDVPLVLHGGSGVPLDVMSEITQKHRICKVNVGSDFRLRSRDVLLEHINNNEEQLDWWRIFDKGYQERMFEKMEAFGSVGKAWTK
ncbi:class II fructose-bisphosphate aldolase [Eubacteriales bacterium OttesenSCG-928-N14]|nr:class II fructose-bisphosphate aldolase [Eubacteriales bacterium OttesenSCG-928-N14]